MWGTGRAMAERATERATEKARNERERERERERAGTAGNGKVFRAGVGQVGSSILCLREIGAPDGDPSRRCAYVGLRACTRKEAALLSMYQRTHA